MFYVYVLFSQKDKNFYTGFSSNLKKRIKEHSNGLSKATKSRRPLTLIYYEAYLTENDAYKREEYLHTSMGRRVLKKQLACFLKTVKSDKITIKPSG